jgi:hypothetical protein
MSKPSQDDIIAENTRLTADITASPRGSDPFDGGEGKARR